MKRNHFIEIVCLLYVFLFVYAAVSKLVDVHNFRVLIGQSPLLTKYAAVLAIAVPVIELLISFLLIIPSGRLIGLFAAFTIMVMFTAYIAFMLAYNEHIPCACGGVLEILGWKEHLVFNLVFVVLALVGILLFVSAKRGEYRATEHFMS